MNYLNLNSTEIKLSGGGVKLAWAGVIGAAIDMIAGKTGKLPTDNELLTQIKSHISNQVVRAHVGDPSQFTPAHKAAIDQMLKSAGTQLSTADLHQAFATHPIMTTHFTHP